MPHTLLTVAERTALAASLPLWQAIGNSIERDFTFGDFSAAWGFMSRVALLAEQHGHHPD